MVNDLTLKEEGKFGSFSNTYFEVATAADQRRVASECGYVLPKGVFHSISKFPDDEKFGILASYNGVSNTPSFAEWTENVIQNLYLKRLGEATFRRNWIAQNYKKAEVELAAAQKSGDPDALKDANREITRVGKMLTRQDEFVSKLTNELNKSAQETLRREKPRKIEMTTNTVSVSQFQNMVNGIDESKVIDADYEEVNLNE